MIGEMKLKKFKKVLTNNKKCDIKKIKYGFVSVFVGL